MGPPSLSVSDKRKLLLCKSTVDNGAPDAYNAKQSRKTCDQEKYPGRLPFRELRMVESRQRAFRRMALGGRSERSLTQ
jgi:hypothetical protein